MTGKVLHEFVHRHQEGTRRACRADAQVPGHGARRALHGARPPGKTGEIVWTFNRAGEFDFACLIAGHYQAGMVGKIPKAIGLAVPGMPIGSPGMDGPDYDNQQDPYDVLLVQADGSTRVFNHYPGRK
jgi:hypothetical protein